MTILDFELTFSFIENKNKIVKNWSHRRAYILTWDFLNIKLRILIIFIHIYWIKIFRFFFTFIVYVTALWNRLLYLLLKFITVRQHWIHFLSRFFVMFGLSSDKFSFVISHCEWRLIKIPFFIQFQCDLNITNMCVCVCVCVCVFFVGYSFKYW